MLRKYGKVKLNRGVVVTKRGYVLLRLGPYLRKPLYIGKASDPEVFEIAERKRLQILLDMRMGQLEVTKLAQEATIEQACDAFMQLHGNNLSSRYVFSITFRRLCALFPGRNVSTFSFTEVEHYREVRKNDGAPDSSINREHTCITSLFNKLRRGVATKKIEPIKLPVDNPGALVHKQCETKYVRKRVLSREEYERLLHCVTPRVKAIIQAAIYSLLRLKDLRKPQGAHNDATEVLTLTQAKTGKAVWFNISEQDYRSILGTLDFTNFRKEFEEGVARAHLENFTFRDLRRTGATWLYKATGDKKLVSDRLGHATIEMTERYLGIQSEDRTQASKIMKDLAFRPHSAKSVHPGVTQRLGNHVNWQLN